MFVEVIDYHGHPVRIDPSRVIKFRPTFVANDPPGCTLIDFASGGVFAEGPIEQVGALFAPYIRLASLHAPNGVPILLNADGIAAILAPDESYEGANSMAIVTVEFENRRVPLRNKIPLEEAIAEAERIISNATLG